jgi:hypothetical protein
MDDAPTCGLPAHGAEYGQALVKIPVLKVDDPMVDRALGMGQRVGLAATAATALAPVAALVRNRARVRNQSVTVDAVMGEGLMPA